MGRAGKLAIVIIVILGLLTAMPLSACGFISIDMHPGDHSQTPQPPQESQQEPHQDSPSESTAPPVAVIPEVLVPTASGVDVEENGQAIVDFSNKQDGYIMARYIEDTDMEIRLLIMAPDGVQYQYALHPGQDFEAFPLSASDGLYEIGVWKQVEGTRYSMVLSTVIDVVLVDEFAPFLRPNQFVNFNSDSEVVRKAAELTAGITGFMDRLSAIYHFVINNIVYDVELAETVQLGYVPDVDSVLASGKGICFDYSSLITAMLRSQGIPTKLVIGFTADVKHAWISVYSVEDGWLDDVIFFDGHSWELVDPTFAAAGATDLSAYIGDGANYIINTVH